MSAPYLVGALRRAFDAWLDGLVRRHSSTLAFREIRRGAQALSALYVQGRRRGDLGRRALDGRGKRAALATYYAPLHLLTVHHAVVACEETGAFPPPARIRRLLDWGCGTGATGAGVAATLGTIDVVHGLDRSGWAVGEARNVFPAFGLAGRARRGPIPGIGEGRPPGASDLITLGWVVNELDEPGRKQLLEVLAGAAERGAGMLVFEPLSQETSPWWEGWAEALSPLGARAELVRLAIERPQWIEELDRASGLDHRVIGARVIACPPRAQA